MNSNLPVHIVNLNQKMLRINSLQCVNMKLNTKKVKVTTPKVRSQENSMSARSSKKKKDELNVDLAPVTNRNYMSDNLKKFQNAEIK